MTAAELLPLMSLSPASLAAHLAAMPYAEAQRWIDGIFDVAEEHDNENAAGLFDLAWRANDVAVLLKRGAKPGEIRHSPYRGIFARPAGASERAGAAALSAAIATLRERLRINARVTDEEVARRHPELLAALVVASARETERHEP